MIKKLLYICTIFILIVIGTYFYLDQKQKSQTAEPKKLLTDAMEQTVRGYESCKGASQITTTLLKNDQNTYYVVDCLPFDWSVPIPMESSVGIFKVDANRKTSLIMFNDIFSKVYLDEAKKIMLEKEVWVPQSDDYFIKNFADNPDYTPAVEQKLHNDKTDCSWGDGVCYKFQKKFVYEYDEVLQKPVLLKELTTSDTY